MPWVIKKNGKYLSLRYPVNHWKDSLYDAEVFGDSYIDKEMAETLASGYDAQVQKITMQEDNN